MCQIIQLQLIRKQQKTLLVLPLLCRQNVKVSGIVQTEHSLVILCKLLILPIAFFAYQEKYHSKFGACRLILKPSKLTDGMWREIQMTSQT